jgi:hypothetical protein
MPRGSWKRSVNVPVMLSSGRQHRSSGIPVVRFVSIVVLCIVAAVLYGVVHDQITARICVEYFTIEHPPVFGTDDPTLLGLGWGVIATWWVGLILGVLLALSSRVGSWPQLSAKQLVRPLAIMLAVVVVVAFVAGVVGNVAASRRWVWLLEPMASQVPQDRHVAFLTDLWAHLASYIGGFLGGILLCGYAIVRRARAQWSGDRYDPPLEQTAATL